MLEGDILKVVDASVIMGYFSLRELKNTESVLVDSSCRSRHDEYVICIQVDDEYNDVQVLHPRFGIVWCISSAFLKVS